MNDKEKQIIIDYREKKDLFKKLERIALEKLEQIVKDCNVRIYTINHRIKEEDSLFGKLERKGDKYNSLFDITDILGLRLVCYFADEVDVLARRLEESFNIDWTESIDKRKFLSTNSFGYLSVHYICSLKESKELSPDILNIRFEVQMCSLLQHVWAVMEHDLGYKTKFGVPRAVSRDFSRLAGLLEIADEHFTRIRDTVSNYTEHVRQKIENDDANDIPIDSVSLDEYMRSSKNMRAFLQVIANMCNAEIYDETAENYIQQLAWLRIETIGELQQMMARNNSLALQMARTSLAVSKLDIFSSTVALRFLCRAELVSGEYTEKQMREFFSLSIKDKDRCARYAKELFLEYNNSNNRQEQL